MDRDLKNQTKKLLLDWQAGIIDEKEVHETAELLWDEGDESRSWKDYSETDPRSITVEALSQLEILNHQLITIEDIPAFLDFLDTPKGYEKQAWDKWRKYWSSLDLENRRKKLAHNKYYSV